MKNLGKSRPVSPFESGVVSADRLGQVDSAVVLQAVVAKVEYFEARVQFEYLGELFGAVSCDPITVLQFGHGRRGEKGRGR